MSLRPAWRVAGLDLASYPAARWLRPAGPGANDVLRIGLIGCGIRGKYLIGNLSPEGRVMAICDCCAPRMAGQSGWGDDPGLAGGSCLTYNAPSIPVNLPTLLLLT